MSRFASIILVFILLTIAFSVSARGVYQSDDDFLAESFNTDIPKSKVIWIKGELREEVANILGHPYDGLRIRYWPKDRRNAWILEEIGKEQPITFGVVTYGGKVEKVKVLAFRESRGGEIRYPAFTQQFMQAARKNNALDRNIDGISGATLSVRAMTAIVTLALYLDDYIQQ
jgi:hypothetical protein